MAERRVTVKASSVLNVSARIVNALRSLHQQLVGFQNKGESVSPRWKNTLALFVGREMADKGIACLEKEGNEGLTQEEFVQLCFLSSTQDALPQAEAEEAASSASTKSLGVNAVYLRALLKQCPPDMTTSEMKRKIVVPATMQQQCTLVDHLLSLQGPLHDGSVGPATVFVSHAYSYLVRDTIEVMLAYEEEHPNSYFWFDPFNLNPHTSQTVLTPAELEKVFGDQIQGIGAVLVVASPWNDPVFLKRAWCLFELYKSVERKVSLVIRQPRSQERAFLDDLNAGSVAIYDILSSIDGRKAEARIEADRKAIVSAIEASIGFVELNKLALSVSREWLADVSLKELKRLCALADGAYDHGAYDALKAVADFAYPCAIMLERLCRPKQCYDVACKAVAAREAVFGSEDPKTLNAAMLMVFVSFKYRIGRIGEKEMTWLKRALQSPCFEVGEGSQMKNNWEFVKLMYAKHGNKLFDDNFRHALALEADDSQQLVRNLEQQLSKLESEKGPEHKDTVYAVWHLARAKESLKDPGKLERLLVMYERCLEGFIRVLGPKHPHVLYSANQIAWTLQRQKQYTRASKIYRQYLPSFEEVLGVHHMETLQVTDNLAETLECCGDLAESAEMTKKVLIGREATLGSNHPKTLCSYFNYGKVLRKLGELEEALAMHKHELESMQGDQKSARETIKVLRLLTKKLQKEGRREEAAAGLREAAEIATRYKIPLTDPDAQADLPD